VVADSQYRFPPGPETNLLRSALRKLRPANSLNLFPHLAEKYGDAAHCAVNLGCQLVISGVSCVGNTHKQMR
jgi:hypothetical protein